MHVSSYKILVSTVFRNQYLYISHTLKIKRFKKHIILLSGLAAIILHFTLLFLYANPAGASKGKMSFLVHAYAYPWFHQNWNLFAPAPDSNYMLFVTYQHNGAQRIDVFNEILSLHRANRLKGYEPLVMAFSNSIHFFEKSTVLQQAMNGPVKNDMYFDMLAYAAKNYLKHTRGIDVYDLRLALVVDNIHSRRRRVYFN